MCEEQEAFDEAFQGIVGELALDRVIADLARAGVVVERWQRDLVSAWLWIDEDLPMPVRLVRLRWMLKVSLTDARVPPHLMERWKRRRFSDDEDGIWQERCWQFIQDIGRQS